MPLRNFLSYVFYRNFFGALCEIVMFRLFFTGLISFLIFIPVGHLSAKGGNYIITQIAELPLGTTHVVRSANESGDVVGTINKGRHGPLGAIWGNGGNRDIKTPRANSDFNLVLGINDTKQVVGTTNTDTGMRAFRSMPDGTSAFLDEYANDTSNSAIAVNASGKVVGWSSGSDGMRAVIWDSTGKIESLPPLNGSKMCRGLVINNAGDVAGTCDTESGSRAVLWENSAKNAVDLGTLPGDDWSSPASMNNKGDIVGSSGDSDTHRAVLWKRSEKTIKNLGVLTGRVSSKALGINNRGDVVGYSEGGHSREHAFLWTNKDGMQDLNDLLAINSGFVLVQAVGINSQGVISVMGYDEMMNPDNHLHDEQLPMRIFRLQPIKGLMN